MNKPSNIADQYLRLNVESVEGLRSHHHSRPGIVVYNTAKGAMEFAE